MGLDIGPDAIKQFEEALKGAKVIILTFATNIALSFLQLQPSLHFGLTQIDCEGLATNI